MSRVLKSLVCESLLKAGLALLVAIALSAPMHAQLLRGGVSGTVIDEQKALVSGVRITLTSQERGVIQTATTNDVGFYRLTAVDPGTYSVEFSKDGFETYKSGSFDVQAGKDTTIDTPPLKVGAVSSQVYVTIPGMELDKTGASVRLNLPGRILDEIPMTTSSLVPTGSRNFSRYALFTPGVVRVLFQNETSANGHRGRENNFMIDGTDNNDQSVTLPALFIPPEAIQEVDLQAATFSAEYGRNIGAQINVITKSGTNRYKGELWEFYRGNALEGLALSDWIAIKAQKGLTDADKSSVRNPRLVDNQFGGSIGGPIIQNKTFFFGMVQGNLFRTGPRAQSLVRIPTQAGYTALQTVPLRATPTPQSAESRQAVLDALSFLPSVYSTVSQFNNTTTTTVNGTSIEMGTFSPVVPTHQNIWYGAVRVDHQLSQNDRLTYRSHIDRRVSPLSSGNLQFGDRWAADTKYYAQNHFLGYTRNIGSRFVNEARVSYARLFPTAVERDSLTPTVTISNTFQIGGSSSFPQDRLEQTWQFQDVSTYVLSRHTLKFGVDLARTKLWSNSAANLKGTWVFSNLQDFLNSQANSVTFLGARPTTYQFHQLRQAYFFQDDFKLTRNLTTNIGLRYETSSVPLGMFGATTPEVLNALVPGPVQRDKNNWGPRVGFAYSPQFQSGLLGTLMGDGKSSIRGGFGIGYDVLFYSLLANTAGNYPRTDTQTRSGSSAPVDLFPALPPRGTTPTLNSGTVFVNMPSDSQNPTSNYWSLSIQRQVHTNYSVEIGYNGNRSYHLIRQGQANPGILSAEKAAAVVAGCTSTAVLPGCQDPAGFSTSPSRLDPNWASRILLETTGKASYNGVYVQINGRANFGLRFGANYTWSSNLSDSEEFSNDSAASDGGLASSSPQVPQSYVNVRNEWARSVFDRPHRATFNYTYDIPWFRSGQILDQIFKGWQVSGFTEVQSGQPFTIKLGVDALGIGTAASARPDYNPSGVITLDPSTGNLRTFVIPKDGTGIVTAPHVTNAATGAVTFLKNSMPLGGTLGRNTFRGPGYTNTNISLVKKINLPGDRLLQVRGDFINVFNHDNFPNPDANMSSSTFGKQVYKPLTDVRQVLLGLKLAF